MASRAAAAALLLMTLKLAAAMGGVRAATEAGCRTYASKGLIKPEVGSLQDVIVVQDAFVVEDATVTLNVSHRRIGALRITLGAQPFASDGALAHNHPQVTLKSQGLGRRGDNLFRTTFSDCAADAFPANASFAPFTGSWRPVQRLGFLTDGDLPVAGAGGSQGLWTLTIADVAPNNTLREIALNGWSLLLCERGFAAPAPQPSPPTPQPSPSAPQPAVGSPPAPTVSSFSGPPSVDVTIRAPSAPPAATPTTSTLPGGWKVVYKGAQGEYQLPVGNTPPGAASPPVAPGTFVVGGGDAAPVAGPLQQLMAQRPMLTLLEQQIATITAGMASGTCDASCQQAKKNLWAAAAIGLYIGHRDHGKDVPHSWIEKLRQLLPGENRGLKELHAWMGSHHDQLKGLAAFLRKAMKLPQMTVNGQPLKLGSGSEDFQQLASMLANGGEDSLRKLMGAFAAAGERLSTLASGLGSGEGLKGLLSALPKPKLDLSGLPKPGQGLLAGAADGAMASLFTGVAQQLAAGAAKAQDKRQEAVAGLAGGLDDRLTGMHSWLSGMQGASLDDVSAAGLAEMSQSLQALFDLSSF